MTWDLNDKDESNCWEITRAKSKFGLSQYNPTAFGRWSPRAATVLHTVTNVPGAGLLVLGGGEDVLLEKVTL